jgi:hypothetical protein
MFFLADEENFLIEGEKSKIIGKLSVKGGILFIQKQVRPGGSPLKRGKKITLLRIGCAHKIIPT